MADNFVFRKSDKVGVADAKADSATLLVNFVETGDYDAITDFTKPERFILGRAGVGKTALITRLAHEKDNVITIEPESLSLGYISNSTIIQTLSELGVDFGLFYKLLWRHVLVVEILKHHFGISDENTQVSVLDKLRSMFSQNKQTKSHIKALEYMEKFGNKFWEETNHRIKEIKEKIESDLEGELGANIHTIKASIKAGTKVTNEQTIEIIHKAQDIINSVQMKELSGLMNMLDDAIDDRQKHYYLIIDKLDESWVDENIRYELIMALIETIKDFAVVKQVKPMVVLRSDLLSKVYDQTSRAGFQEEKFASLNLHVSWTKEQMAEMLDKRIDYLIKSRYTKKVVTHLDILPDFVKGRPALDYMIDRTLMRPRDLIDFFNTCIEEAIDSPVVTEAMIIQAEREYSRNRRSAVRDEWRSEYPNLPEWDQLLDSMDKEFFISDLALNKIEQIALTATRGNESGFDKVIGGYLEESDTKEDLRKSVVIALFNAGYISIELPGKVTLLPHKTKKGLHKEEITEDTICRVLPMFYSCFNIKDIV